MDFGALNPIRFLENHTPKLDSKTAQRSESSCFIGNIISGNNVPTYLSNIGCYDFFSYQISICW